MKLMSIDAILATELPLGGVDDFICGNFSGLGVFESFDAKYDKMIKDLRQIEIYLLESGKLATYQLNFNQANGAVLGLGNLFRAQRNPKEYCLQKIGYNYVIVAKRTLTKCIVFSSAEAWSAAMQSQVDRFESLVAPIKQEIIRERESAAIYPVAPVPAADIERDRLLRLIAGRPERTIIEEDPESAKKQELEKIKQLIIGKSVTPILIRPPTRGVKAMAVPRSCAALSIEDIGPRPADPVALVEWEACVREAGYNPDDIAGAEVQRQVVQQNPASLDTPQTGTVPIKDKPPALGEKTSLFGEIFRELSKNATDLAKVQIQAKMIKAQREGKPIYVTPPVIRIAQQSQRKKVPWGYVAGGGALLLAAGVIVFLAMRKK